MLRSPPQNRYCFVPKLRILSVTTNSWIWTILWNQYTQFQKDLWTIFILKTCTDLSKSQNYLWNIFVMLLSLHTAAHSTRLRVCVCVYWVCKKICYIFCRYPQRVEVSDLLELKLQFAICHLKWEYSTLLRSSGREATTFNCQISSPTAWCHTFCYFD